MAQNIARKLWLVQFTTRTCLVLHYKSEGVTGIERMEIIPFQSCGKLLFGMTREQVEAVLGDAGRDEGADGCLPNAQLVWYCNMRYHICYLDGRMEWVEVPNPEDENSDVSLYGICLFQSRAEDAVRALEQYGACIHDCPDPELSYTCWFENLGVTLWRDQIYHPKRMKDDAYAADFRAMPRENQQDVLRFWHFQSVAAESKVYQTLCGALGIPRV